VKPLLKYLVGLVLILGVLGIFYSRTNRVISEEHGRFQANLQKFITLDTTVNEDVLKVRFHLLSDYDGLSDELEEMNLTAGQLTPVPAFIPRAKRQVMEQKILGLRKLLAEKGQLLEQFKSQNAVLENSTRYLPLACMDLFNRVSTNETHSRLEAPLNELMQQC